MLNLHRLRLLRELKMRGTVAAVAAALSYTPSAISQQLNLLEREVGVPLLESAGRYLRLTRDGEVLVTHVDVIMDRLEMAEADLASSSETVHGVLRVATFQTAALALFPRVLTALAEQHPRLRVLLSDIPPDHATSALVAHDFDVVLGEEYPGVPHKRQHGIHRQDVARDPLLLYLPIGCQAGDLHDLTLAPWVMEPQGNSARQWAMALCREAGFEPDVRFESPDLLVHLHLVETGHAAALLPRLVFAGRQPSAQIIEPRGQPSRTIFTAVRKGGEGRPDVRAFRALIAGVYESILWRGDADGLT